MGPHQTRFFEGSGGRGFKSPWACLHYDCYWEIEVEYSAPALRFYLSTFSIVVKRLSGQSQSWGPQFDSRPKRTQVGMSVPIDLREHCWQVMCTTTELDSNLTNPSVAKVMLLYVQIKSRGPAN